MTLKHYLLLAVFHLLSFVGCRAQNSVAPMNIGNVFMKFGETETSVPIKLTSFTLIEQALSAFFNVNYV